MSKKTTDKNFIETIFFVELIQGLIFTFKKLFEKKDTLMYPYEPSKLAQNTHGIHYMREKSAGVTACTGCQSCAKACPSKCIDVDKMKNPDAPGTIPTHYVIDLSRCIYCGFCEDACPFDAIHLGASLHGAYKGDRAKMRVDLKDLTENYHIYSNEFSNQTYGLNYGFVKKFKNKTQVHIADEEDLLIDKTLKEKLGTGEEK